MCIYPSIHFRAQMATKKRPHPSSTSKPSSTFEDCKEAADLLLYLLQGIVLATAQFAEAVDMLLGPDAIKGVTDKSRIVQCLLRMNPEARTDMERLVPDVLALAQETMAPKDAKKLERIEQAPPFQPRSVRVRYGNDFRSTVIRNVFGSHVKERDDVHPFLY